VSKKSVEIRVSVDVGYRRHSVAIGLPSGEVLEEFEIAHRPEGFAEFFSRIEKHQKIRDCSVAVAMEGFNGCARPLGRKYASLIEGWQKRAHFSEEVEWVSEMIQEDAQRCLELDEKIKSLKGKIKDVAKDSKFAKILLSIPGFGTICTAELAGEIGPLSAFPRKGVWRCT
jgi:hypothetical protein